MHLSRIIQFSVWVTNWVQKFNSLDLIYLITVYSTIPEGVSKDMRWNAWKVATLISLILILANKKSHPHRCVAGQFFKKNLKIHGKTTIMEFNFTEKSDFFTDIFLWSLDDSFSAKPFGPPDMAGSDSRIYWKIFLPRKWGKWAKIRVFNSLEILLIHFF